MVDTAELAQPLSQVEHAREVNERVVDLVNQCAALGIDSILTGSVLAMAGRVLVSAALPRKA